jgi:hypothetical protein
VLNVETSAAAHEPELGRATLASHRSLLVTQQRPFLAQLVEFDRPIHDRDTPATEPQRHPPLTPAPLCGTLCPGSLWLLSPRRRDGRPRADPSGYQPPAQATFMMGNHLSGAPRLKLAAQLEQRGGQASQSIRSAGGLNGTRRRRRVALDRPWGTVVLVKRSYWQFEWPALVPGDSAAC